MPLPPAQACSFSPYGLNFGSVPQSTSAPAQVIRITSIGTGTANVTINPLDSRYVATPSGNLSIPTGTFIDVSFVFNASAVLGSSSTTFFTFTGGGTIPGSPTLQAITVSGGVPAWNVSPSVINFGSLKIGTSSAPVTVTISNTGTGSLIINSIALTPTDFTLGGLPSFPVTIASGNHITFTAVCNSTFRGTNDYTPGITVTPSVGPSQTVELIYTGFILTPAYTLTGATQGVLFGLAGQWNTTLRTYVAQSKSQLAPEADASLIKMHDFGNPSSYTYANRMYIRTECFGEVTSTLDSTGVISGNTKTSSDTKTRSAATDNTGIPTDVIFDVETNGEIHKLVLNVPANSGLLSITQYTLCYEKRGDVYETA